MTSQEFINPLNEEDYLSRIESKDEDIRGPYFRDQTAIVHSMPFRRLKHKAQVFFSPKNDHVCTRIEHALHVATIAATIAKGLGLNIDLAYAIGLGHDLGHAPFGHAGETALKSKCKDIGGFIHEIHGLRVVDVIGNQGQSLNLTYAVRDGIVCHCGEAPDKCLEPRKNKIDLVTIKERNIMPSSYEGCVARMADRIAYLGSDLEDSIIGNFIRFDEIPKEVIAELGNTNADIIDTLVIDVIQSSQQNRKITSSDDKYKALMKLYKFSNENLYNHEKIVRYRNFCERIIDELFEYLLDIYSRWNSQFESYFKSPGPLDRRFGRYLQKMSNTYSGETASPKAIIRDYIAGMTDDYAIRCMKEISLPEDLSFDQPIKTNEV